MKRLMVLLIGLVISFQVFSQNITNEKISQAITIHDVGGWHPTIMENGFYEPTIERIANVVKANTVTIVDTLWITDARDNTLVLKSSPHLDWHMAPNEEETRYLSRFAKERGLDTQLFINLYALPRNIQKRQWWQVMNKPRSNRKFWDSFFGQFSEMVVDRAKVAQQEGVDSIAFGFIGGNASSADIKYWSSMIDRIRNEAGYTGKLGYYTHLSVTQKSSALSSIGTSQAKKLVDLMDFVGFAVQDVSSKKSLVRALKKYSYVKKPIYIMVKTPSVKRGNRNNDYVEPCVKCSGGKTTKLVRDWKMQKQVYQDVIDIVNDPQFSNIRGVDSWGYSLREEFHQGNTDGDSAYDKSASIRSKPAEELLAKWYDIWEDI